MRMDRPRRPGVRCLYGVACAVFALLLVVVNVHGISRTGAEPDGVNFLRKRSKYVNAKFPRKEFDVPGPEYTMHPDRAGPGKGTFTVHPMEVTIPFRESVLNKAKKEFKVTWKAPPTPSPTPEPTPCPTDKPTPPAPPPTYDHWNDDFNDEVGNGGADCGGLGDDCPKKKQASPSPSDSSSSTSKSEAKKAPAPQKKKKKKAQKKKPKAPTRRHPNRPTKTKQEEQQEKEEPEKQEQSPEKQEQEQNEPEQEQQGEESPQEQEQETNPEEPQQQQQEEEEEQQGEAESEAPPPPPTPQEAAKALGLGPAVAAAAVGVAGAAAAAALSSPKDKPKGGGGGGGGKKKKKFPPFKLPAPSWFVKLHFCDKSTKLFDYGGPAPPKSKKCAGGDKFKLEWKEFPCKWWPLFAPTVVEGRVKLKCGKRLSKRERIRRRLKARRRRRRMLMRGICAKAADKPYILELYVSGNLEWYDAGIEARERKAGKDKKKIKKLKKANKGTDKVNKAKLIAQGMSRATKRAKNVACYLGKYFKTQGIPDYIIHYGFGMKPTETTKKPDDPQKKNDKKKAESRFAVIFYKNNAMYKGPFKKRGWFAYGAGKREMAEREAAKRAAGGKGGAAGAAAAALGKGGGGGGGGSSRRRRKGIIQRIKEAVGISKKTLLEEQSKAFCPPRVKGTDNGLKGKCLTKRATKKWAHYRFRKAKKKLKFCCMLCKALCVLKKVPGAMDKAAKGVAKVKSALGH